MTRHDWLELLLIRVPILKWVWTYQASYFFGDILSGITVAIMHIPQGTHTHYNTVTKRADACMH